MNSYLCLSFLATLVLGCAWAYDFQNEEYTFDMEELEEFMTKHQGSPVNVRDRRSVTEASKEDDKDNKDGHCRKHKMKFCCAEEQFKELHNEKELEVKKECYLEIHGANATLPHFLSGEKDKDKEQKSPLDGFNPEKARKWKGDIACVTECVAKRKNLIKENGELNDAEAEKWARTAFPEEYQKEIMKTAIPKCVAESRDKTVELPTFGHHNVTQNPRPDGSFCSTAPLKFGFCIYREIQLNCPKDQIKNEETCAKVLEKIKTKRAFPVPAEH